MAKRNSYQDRIIKRYYQNRDDIMLQRLGELVTDLYLAEGKSRVKVWERIAAALQNLKLPPADRAPRGQRQSLAGGEAAGGAAEQVGVGYASA